VTVYSIPITTSEELYTNEKQTSNNKEQFDGTGHKIMNELNEMRKRNRETGIPASDIYGASTKIAGPYSAIPFRRYGGINP
jgi:hypothetical protein